MKRSLIIALTICIVVSLVFFLRATDLNRVISLIEETGYKFCLLLLVTFLAYLFGTISWQFALGEYYNSVSTTKLFLVRHIGETVGMFNPASVIGGDALKAVMLRDYQIPERKVMWSILFSRAIMVLSQLMLSAATAIALLLQHPSLAMQEWNHQKGSALYPMLVLRWKSFRLKCSSALRELPAMLRENKRMLLFSFFFALLHWFVGGLEFYLILKFLGVKVSILKALMVDLGVVLFKAAGAVIPGQLGIEEYGNKIMLLAIGVPGEEVWVAASILRRARQLFWIAFGIGVYFLIFKKRRVPLLH